VVRVRLKWLPSGTDGIRERGDGDRTVRVSATGSVGAEPDRAVVRVRVVECGEAAPTARGALASNTPLVRESLREAAVADDRRVRPPLLL
jgi:uncharacterized protein YggE